MDVTSSRSGYFSFTRNQVSIQAGIKTTKDRFRKPYEHCHRFANLPAFQRVSRYFFHIAYNGYNYHGWQRQPNANSVQEVIESRLRRILKTETVILGCGRTDARVHASQYFFHADIDRPWDDELTSIVNKNLPADISIFEVIPVGQQHAQFDAIERTYNYFIHTYHDPFLSTISSFYPERKLNIDAIKKAISLLPEHHDYRNFCRKQQEHRSTLCNIRSAQLYIDQHGDNIRVEITANRFLNGMIRMIVERLLMVGRGQISMDEFSSLLTADEAPVLIKIAHPQGLYLSKVKYPFLDTPSRSTLFNALTSRFSLPY